MAKIIWTQDMRKILFARMKMEFGAFATWGGVSYPIDNKVRFDQVAKELASFFSEMVGSSITSGAVKNQLQWGITKQEEN